MEAQVETNAKRFTEIKQTFSYKIVMSQCPNILRNSESIDRHINLLAEEVCFGSVHPAKLDILRNRIDVFQTQIDEEMVEIKKTWDNHTGYALIFALVILCLIVIF